MLVSYFIFTKFGTFIATKAHMDTYKETFESWNKVATLYQDKFMDLTLYQSIFTTMNSAPSIKTWKTTASRCLNCSG